VYTSVLAQDGAISCTPCNTTPGVTGDSLIPCTVLLLHQPRPELYNLEQEQNILRRSRTKNKKEEREKKKQREVNIKKGAKRKNGRRRRQKREEVE
jgi:hypothetical protein